MNIKIKSIEITNFKGIKDLKLDFTYPESDNILNNIIFYGINGSRKSTILEAIYICFKEVFINKEMTENKNLKSIEANYIDSSFIYNNKEEFNIKIELLIENKQFFINFTYNKNTSKWFEFKPPLKYIPDEFINFITYLSSYRFLNFTNIYSPGSWNEIENSNNNYASVKQYLVNLITDKKVGALSKKNKIILENIKKSFKIFFPEKEFMEELDRPEEKGDYRLKIKNEDGSIVDLDQLSSGEREVIAFFTYLSIETKENSIIIIDEPELHLHAKWQAIVLPAIHKVFPDSQIFLATHSSEIHQSASESELFELIKDES